MKLMNLGHAQSDETRLKIAIRVKEGWRRRRKMLSVQEKCVLEWQSFIAVASRTGYGGQEELQWDSYKVLNEKIKDDWLESAKLRRTTSYLKGHKRAPKSLEQRRRISEAIFAKWADPEYRERVRAALAKYHGKAVGEKTPKKSKTKVATLRSISDSEDHLELSGVKGSNKPAKRSFASKANCSPSFTDPMSSSKLEMIRSIRLRRVDVETRKHEAIERAKLLIAEAEKASKALEVAALKSPLARASLLETRRLIAEAIRSIRSIESGASTFSQGDEPGRDEIELKSDPGFLNGKARPDQPSVNGAHVFLGSCHGANAVNGIRPANFVLGEDVDDLWAPIGEGIKPQPACDAASSSTSSDGKARKKWFCGRFVEIVE